MRYLSWNRQWGRAGSTGWVNLTAPRCDAGAWDVNRLADGDNFCYQCCQAGPLIVKSVWCVWCREKSVVTWTLCNSPYVTWTPHNSDFWVLLLSGQVHAYCSSPYDRHDFFMPIEGLNAAPMSPLIPGSVRHGLVCWQPPVHLSGAWEQTVPVHQCDLVEGATLGQGDFTDLAALRASQKGCLAPVLRFSFAWRGCGAHPSRGCVIAEWPQQNRPADTCRNTWGCRVLTVFNRKNRRADKAYTQHLTISPCPSLPCVCHTPSLCYV